MDAADILFAPEASIHLKHAILEVVQADNITNPNIPVLVPTDTNDDVNGSQNTGGGGTDFTYRDAETDDLEKATGLGYYEYFSGSHGDYTGHYYNGDGRHFEAIVINPPAYAVTHTI